MSEALLWQVYANSIECLSLCFIDSHSIGQMKRELGLMQNEWMLALIKFDSWNHSRLRVRFT